MLRKFARAFHALEMNTYDVKSTFSAVKKMYGYLEATSKL